MGSKFVVRGSFVVLVCLANGLTMSARAHAQGNEPLLPDIIVRRADLFDNQVVTNIEPGHTHLIFSTGTPNIGTGKLQLLGLTPPNPDGTQNVMQRVFHADETFVDHESGIFIFHEEHNHIHIEDWAHYRLRGVLQDDGVGEIIADSEKTSFCIFDLMVFNEDLPNFSPTAEFRTCKGNTQGLSVGWLDFYDKELPGQNIDITGIPAGIYWLEAEVDPDDHIQELDNGNNIARIQVTLGDPDSIPDAYEPNDIIVEVEQRLPGVPRSPNLGPCNPKRVIDGLKIHVNDRDYFKFYSNHTGSLADFVRIDFDHDLGDLDLALLDEQSNVITVANGRDNREIISLFGLPEGWYYVQIFGKDGDINLNYRLTINPPENQAPALEVLLPSTGDTKKIHGSDTYTLKWSATDPEDDPLWISVYLNHERHLDDHMEIVTTARFLDAHLGTAIINSAEFRPDTYWIYFELTDGGSTVGRWAEGTVTFVDFDERCRVSESSDLDCNDNELIDACEIEATFASDCNHNGIPDACDITEGILPDDDGDGVPDDCSSRFHRGDTDADGALNISDGARVFSFLFQGTEPPTCLETMDADNNGKIVIGDGIYLLNFLFLGGPAPPAPGPPGLPCDIDPDLPGSAGDLGCDRYTGC